jgi:hypothetical protein
LTSRKRNEMPGILYSQGPALGSGLTMGGQGLAPYGLRHSGQAPKGLGFMGAVPHPEGGHSTELSTEFDMNGKPVEAPLMVPTLTAAELKQLLTAGPNDGIYEKARLHALQRMQKGLSPFAGPQDLRTGLYDRPSVNRVNGALTPNPNQRPLNPPVIGARG